MSGNRNPPLLDIRERMKSDDPIQLLRAALDGRQSGLWTAMPGVIKDVNLVSSRIVVSVQPAIQVYVSNPDGTVTLTTLPLCPDVPLVVSHGGGYMLTFPVQTDDECLLVMASRCIDNWWQSGGVQPPFDPRQHDINDGFAFCGPFSQATKPASISTTTVRLSTVDGTMYVEIDKANKKINLFANDNRLSMDGQDGTSTWNLGSGNLDISTSGTVDVSAGFLNFSGHQGGGDVNLNTNGTVNVTADIINLNSP